MNQIHEIPLEEIRPAPWNPPSRLDPERVASLADSIKREGQKQAGLVRPVEAEAPVRYELVFGHRRYAAKKVLAERDALQNFLRAEIQEMNDQQAIVVAGIENLQREGFSDLEEAEFFKTCADRYGELAVGILSEKFSISHRYIRKRLEILKLPEAALELWRSGTWSVGHMEQLLRVGGHEEVSSLLEELDNHRRIITVWQLRDMVDDLAVNLHAGHFDKAECKSCAKNTDCQHKLFDLAKEKGTKCLDSDCFVRKEQAWLDLNWATCKQNEFGTQAAIVGDYNTQVTGTFWQWGDSKPGEKCLSCSHFTTVLSFMGERSLHPHRERVCMGEAKCYEEIQKANKGGRNGNRSKDSGGPRVAWHGEYYRQEFYHQEVPKLMTSLPEDDPRRLQSALATLVYSAKSYLFDWFHEKMGLEAPENRYGYLRLELPMILSLTRTLDKAQVEKLMAEALVLIALRKDRGYETSFGDSDRQALAEFLDIDFSQFQVTEEYLNKKTKAELIQFVSKDSGLNFEKEFHRYIQNLGYPSLEKLAQAKKGELINAILNCGIDLRGRLPKEIANRPNLEAEAEDE